MSGELRREMSAGRGRMKRISMLIVALLLVGCAGTAEPDAPPIQTPDVAAGKDSGPSEAEKNYFGAALSYLITVRDQGTRLAVKMAGASDGSSTLTEIKAALSRARMVERLGYEGDYRKRINGEIPPGWSGIAA